MSETRIHFGPQTNVECPLGNKWDAEFCNGFENKTKDRVTSGRM